jgi:hypothetical protein
MTALQPKDITLSLKIGAAASKTFSCWAKTAMIDANAGDTIEYPTLSAGCTYKSAGPTTYDLHLVGVQDWDPAAPSGLAAYLDANDGATAAFWINVHGPAGTAASVTAPAKAGTCTLIAPSYGGNVGEFAEFDVTLPISGKPSLVTTGTAPAILDALVAGDEALVAELAGVVDDEAAEVAA